MMTRTPAAAVCILLLNFTAVSAQPAAVERQTIQINNTAAREAILQRPDVGVKAAPMNTQAPTTNIHAQTMAKDAIHSKPEPNKGVLETIKDGFKRLQQSMAESNQKIKDMQIKSRENMERMKQMNDDAKAAQQRANEQIRQQQEEQRRMLDMQKSSQGGFRR